MSAVTFQVLEGVDKGRVFRALPTPVTIGREEGNILRLNDERVSRFHAKVQHDDGDIILTDLESTNGSRVNGNVVQIRRLRPGDRIALGRSILLFGSNEEIAARMTSLGAPVKPPIAGPVTSSVAGQGPATVHAHTLISEADQDLDFDLNLQGEVTLTEDALFIGQRALPPLPQKMNPAQAARLAEILDFLHRGLNSATENTRANEEGTQVAISYVDWQRVNAVQMLLARYVRAIVEPDVLNE